MAGSLAIDRFQVVAVTPAGHPDPGRIKHAIGRVDQEKLARSITLAVGDFGADDPRFIVLKRLEIISTETTVDDADDIARLLAKGVHAALTRLAGISDAETVVVFPSRTARIAAFVRAAAQGDAWGKWWFSDFDHLKLLPVSSAIRVTLSRDLTIGLKALGGLTDLDRASVLGSLSSIDAEELLGDFAATLAEQDSEDIWVEAFLLPKPVHPWPLDIIILDGLAVLARDAKAPLPRSAITALKTSAQLRRAPDLRSVLTAMRTGSAKRLATMTTNLQPPTFAALASLRPATRARIAAAIAETAAQPAPPEFTRFGGVLLLWPHLPRVLPDLLPDGPGSRPGLLGLLAISALFGVAESAAALDDPILRQLFAVHPQATQEDLAEWLGQVALKVLPPPRRRLQGSRLPPAFSPYPGQNRRVRELGLAALEDFARRLPGLASASLPFLRTNVFGVGARVLTSETGVRAILDRPQFDVLFSISGLADRTIALPDGRALALERST